MQAPSRRRSLPLSGHCGNVPDLLNIYVNDPGAIRSEPHVGADGFQSSLHIPFCFKSKFGIALGHIYSVGPGLGMKVTSWNHNLDGENCTMYTKLLPDDMLASQRVPNLLFILLPSGIPQLGFIIIDLILALLDQVTSPQLIWEFPGPVPIFGTFIPLGEDDPLSRR